MANCVPIVDSWPYRALAWLGIALQAAALIAVVVVERWNGVPSIALFLVLSVAFLQLQERLRSLVSLLVVIAALVNAAGWAWNLFKPVPLYDELVHAFTAFAGMAALGYLGWTRGHIDAAPGTGKFVLVVAAAGLGLGVLWELAEALFFNLAWADTLTDLMVDTIGGALGGVLAGWAIRRQGSQRTLHGPAV